MDYRCPACDKDLGTRKLSQAVMARLETDCVHCKSRLRFNVHRAEFAIVMFNFAAIMVFFAGAYWFPTQRLALYAFVAAMAGALALPVLERTWLRNWPRFLVAAGKAGPRQ